MLTNRAFKASKADGPPPGWTETMRAIAGAHRRRFAGPPVVAVRVRRSRLARDRSTGVTGTRAGGSIDVGL